jgi:hypothetical protein
MIVGGGMMFVVAGTTGPQMERDLLLQIPDADPLIANPGQRIVCSLDVRMRDGRIATMRDLLQRVNQLGHDTFSLAAYLDEYDGTTFHGPTGLYRVKDEWFEEFR